MLFNKRGFKKGMFFVVLVTLFFGGSMLMTNLKDKQGRIDFSEVMTTYFQDVNMNQNQFSTDLVGMATGSQDSILSKAEIGDTFVVDEIDMIVKASENAVYIYEDGRWRRFSINNNLGNPNYETKSFVKQPSDLDGDGASNLYEIGEGYNPLRAESKPKTRDEPNRDVLDLREDANKQAGSDQKKTSAPPPKKKTVPARTPSTGDTDKDGYS